MTWKRCRRYEDEREKGRGPARRGPALWRGRKIPSDDGVERGGVGSTGEGREGEKGEKDKREKEKKYREKKYPEK